MILQRETTVTIWGWADAEEPIKVVFEGQAKETIADNNGNWNVQLSNLQPGGPFKMTLTGKNSITIENILVGDVWLCSGQSNMDIPMSRVAPLYKEEIASANNTKIRQFFAHKSYNYKDKLSDFKSGQWLPATQENILDFTAVGYFFAAEVFKKYNVPIGIIKDAVGGTKVQSWLSEEALKKFPDDFKEAQKLKSGNYYDSIQKAEDKLYNEWYDQLLKKDLGYKTMHWSSNNVNFSSWEETTIPSFWNESSVEDTNGSVWFKKEFTIPKQYAGKEAKVNLGTIVDSDSAWINGTFIGNTTYKYPPRRYTIPKGILQEGKNILTVRVISEIGTGGFTIDKKHELVIEKYITDLSGTWKFKRGAELPPLTPKTYFWTKPLGLYNAMISPLSHYSMKGIVWYQGESNIDDCNKYYELLPVLIDNWRNTFQNKDLPFLIVQLPNFQKANNEPTESAWAVVRDAQLQTAQKTPNTELVVTIDLGEWNDIHPLNKKDVGIRVALAASKIAYGDSSLIYSGPIYKKMTLKDDKIVLSFIHIGSGLKSKNGQLKRFQIAGEDKVFVWANAEIVNNEVIVYSPKVKKPVAVRYAWSDNPEGANLYNNEGLPASPFRTDSWKNEKP